MLVILLVPVALMVLLFALDRLEASVVAPIERAARVERMLASPDPEEEVARQVSLLFAPVVPRRADG